VGIYRLHPSKEVVQKPSQIASSSQNQSQSWFESELALQLGLITHVPLTPLAKPPE